MCTCMYIYIYIYTHAYTHVYIYIYVCRCVYMCMYTHTMINALYYTVLECTITYCANSEVLEPPAPHELPQNINKLSSTRYDYLYDDNNNNDSNDITHYTTHDVSTITRTITTTQ